MGTRGRREDENLDEIRAAPMTPKWIGHQVNGWKTFEFHGLPHGVLTTWLDWERDEGHYHIYVSEGNLAAKFVLDYVSRKKGTEWEEDLMERMVRWRKLELLR